MGYCPLNDIHSRPPLLTTQFLENATEFFAYQVTIIRTERNCEGNRWVIYDRQFHCDTLARYDLNWSITDPRLYNEARHLREGQGPLLLWSSGRSQGSCLVSLYWPLLSIQPIPCIHFTIFSLLTLNYPLHNIVVICGICCPCIIPGNAGQLGSCQARLGCSKFRLHVVISNRVQAQWSYRKLKI